MSGMEYGSWIFIGFLLVCVVIGAIIGADPLEIMNAISQAVSQGAGH